jgi:hypothetical protein
MQNSYMMHTHPVAALACIRLVLQDVCGKLIEDSCRILHGPTLLVRRRGEAETRNGWDDDVECRLSIWRIEQGLDDRAKLIEGTWPSVYDQQCNGIRTRGALVHEMHGDILDIDLEIIPPSKVIVS